MAMDSRPDRFHVSTEVRYGALTFVVTGIHGDLYFVDGVARLRGSEEGLSAGRFSNFIRGSVSLPYTCTVSTRYRGDQPTTAVAVTNSINWIADNGKGLWTLDAQVKSPYLMDVLFSFDCQADYALFSLSIVKD